VHTNQALLEANTQPPTDGTHAPSPCGSKFVELLRRHWSLPNGKTLSGCKLILFSWRFIFGFILQYSLLVGGCSFFSPFCPRWPRFASLCFAWRSCDVHYIITHCVGMYHKPTMFFTLYRVKERSRASILLFSWVALASDVPQRALGREALHQSRLSTTLSLARVHSYGV